MSVEFARMARSHPRLRVDSRRTAAMDCRLRGEPATLEVWDLSMAGIAFVVDADRSSLRPGLPVERAVVRVEGATIHCDVVITHMTGMAGGRTLAGARLYPTTEIDHDRLTEVVARIERERDESPSGAA